MGKLSAFSPIHSLLDIQYIVFKITVSFTCLRIRLHSLKSLSVARYVYVFLNCTLESVSCVDDTVIYETMHRIQIVGASHSCLLER